MNPIIYQNGEYLPAVDAKISVHDSSYLFGEGLFESFRSYNGKVPFLSDHVARLTWSCTYFDWPELAEVDFAGICAELLKRNQREDARFKIICSQDLNPQITEVKLNLVVLCEEIPVVPQVYRLHVDRQRLNDPPIQAAIKSTNYLTKRLARREVKSGGFDDAVLLNAHGRVTEATSGNLFWLDKDARLHTIMSGEGILGGVMRRQVMQILSEKKLKVTETTITPEELSHAREIFLTNSVVGIKPVVAIDQRQISGGEMGPVTQQISEFLDKRIKELTEEKVLH